MPNLTGTVAINTAGKGPRRRVTGWAVALLASTALVAVPPALAPLGVAGVALAAGGASGGGVQGGTSNATTAGEAGSTSLADKTAGGGGGGAGNTGGKGADSGTSAGGAGGTSSAKDGTKGGDSNGSSSGGGGGGGGAHGFVADAAPTQAVTGGKGGTGGSGFVFGSGATYITTGGGGGAGGYGAVLTGSGPYTIGSGITGGAGGNGGAGGKGGKAGDGGYGLLLTQSGATVTVNDGVAIAGGDSGFDGGTSTIAPQSQNRSAGGVGISGGGLTLILSSGATVKGGIGADASTYADAIDLTSGTTSLELQGDGTKYATITGNVVATGSDNTLKFTSKGGTFDLSTLSAATTDATQFQGFGKVVIDTDATWTMTGTQAGTATTAVSVNRGTLQLGSALLNGNLTGDVTVNSGGTLVGGIATSNQNVGNKISGALTVNSGGTVTLAAQRYKGLIDAGSLTLAAGSTLKIDLSGAQQESYFGIIGLTGALSYKGALVITALPTQNPYNKYTLFKSGSAPDSASSFSSITGPDGYAFTTQFDALTNLLTLQVAKGDLYWNGGTTTGTTGPVVGGSGTWSSDYSSNNWTNANGTTRVAADGTTGAVFAGTAGTVTISTTNGDVFARSLTFKTDGYVIQGDPLILNAVSGKTPITVAGEGLTAKIGSIVKGDNGIELLGGGTLVLTGANTFGGATITAGTLQIGDGGKSGSIVGDIANNGKLVFDRADNVTFSGAITGSGSVEKKGAGTLSLANAYTYTGTTTVSGGTLALESYPNGQSFQMSSLAGAVDVQSGGTIMGPSSPMSVGTIGGVLAIHDGGTLAIRTDNMSLKALGGLTLSGSAITALTLGAPVSTAAMQVGGTLTLGGRLDLIAGTGFASGKYRIFDYTGTLTNTGMIVGNAPADSLFGIDTSVDKQVNLTVLAGQYWNGTAGGTGTWTTDGTGWSSGGTAGTWGDNSLAVFGGTAGTVTVDDKAAPKVAGLSFTTDGYTLMGGAITLAGYGGNTSTRVTVQDDKATGGGSATIASDLTGAGVLTKAGSGTLILTGTKTYTGGTTVAGGTLQLGDGKTSGSVQGDIVNNAALVFAPGGDQTFEGVVSGTGTLVKQGAGTLTLSGTSTYTGGTTVAEGTLWVSGEVASPVNVASGGTLRGTGTVGAVTVASGGVLLGVQGNGLTTGNLTLAPGAHFSARLGESMTDLALVTVKGDLTLNGSLDISTATGAFDPGLYHLISYTGRLSGSGLTVGTVGRGVNVPDAAIQSDEVAKTVNLILSPTQASFWNGGKAGTGTVAGGDGTWNANTVWTNQNGSTSTAITDQATAIFSGTPGTVTVDTSAGPVTVAGMQFATSGYVVQGDALTLTSATTMVRVGDGTKEGAASVATIASVLTGSGGVRKTDYGTLVLTGANTFTGGTSVETGTLKLGNAQALGTGAVSLNEGTTLAFAGDLTLANAIRFPQKGDPIIDTGTGTVTVSGEISGVGDLSKVGTGTLILSGKETYTGATVVTAGTLVANGSLASSTGVSVQSGATLGGAGTVPGVTALSGSTVAPGVASAYSTLNVAGAVTFAAGSTFRVQIDATGRTDAIAATGTATLSGGTVDVRAGTGIYSASQSYRILTAAGGRTGQFASLQPTTNLAFLKPVLNYDPTGVSLGFTRATDTGTGTTSGSGTGSGGTTGSTGTGGSTGTSGTTGAGSTGTGTGGTTGTGSTGTGGSSGTGTGSATGAGSTGSGSGSSSGTGSATGTGSTGTGTGSSSGTGTGSATGAGSTGTGSTGTGTGSSGTGGQPVVAFASVAATATQRAVAGAVEALGHGRLYEAVLSQSASGARQAFDAVSGEIHAGAITATIEDTRVVREAVTGRLQEASRQATAAGPALWGTGFGAFGRNAGDGNAAALKRSLGGFVIGADGRVDAPGLSEWRLGVAGGYTDDIFSLNLRSSRGDVKTVFGGLYAGALYGALDLKLGLLAGGTQVTTQRTVLFPGFMDSAHGRADGSLVQGFGEVGYRIALPQGYIEPLVQGALIRIDQDALRETGGAAALQVWSHGAAVGTTTLGVRGEVSLSAQLPLMARGFVGWRHAFGDVAPQALASFAGATTPFAVSGTPVDRDAAVAELGLDYRASEAITLGVSYGAQIGARASDQSVKGRFEYRF